MDRVKLATVSLATLLASASIVSAEDSPFTLTADTDNRVSLGVRGNPPLLRSSPDEATGSLLGNEASQCVPVEQRQSAGSARSASKVVQVSPTSLSLSLVSESFSQGGHYRTCDACVSSVCVGIHGNDTTSRALGEARATVKIQFSSTYGRPGNFELLLHSRSSGISPLILFQDGSGNPILTESKNGVPLIIRGTPGAVYYLTVSLSSSSTDSGGCCNQGSKGDASVDVELRKAPILATGYAFGYIRGGEQTSEFQNVGVITLKGQVHCTGTVVGSKTILTAAHCLQGYENQTADMKFVLGANYQYPVVAPISITNVDYPSGGPGQLSFNPRTFEDDIGVVYISTVASVTPARLYQGQPSWNDIIERNRSLLFVGFGYNVIGSGKVGVGIKREGSWQIDRLENKKFSFSVPGKNTCFGDSGGPSFIEFSGELLVAGVTSNGDDACTYGTETRVDAYQNWLQPRIR